MTDFYPLTSETLSKLYEADLTAAEWRLWTYLSVTDPWGDRYSDLPDTLTILEQVKIKKSTFYAAIAKFQKFELFDFQDKGFAFRNLQGSAKVRSAANIDKPTDDEGLIPKSRNEFQNLGKDSEILESFPKSWNEFRNLGKDSEIPENQPPEPLPEKDSKSPQTIQTLKTLKDTTEGEGSVQKINFLEQEEDPFVKYQDRLRLYAIYLYVRSGEELIPNPKLKAVKKAIAGVPATKVEAGIRAFLAWIKDSRNVQNQYKALETAILKGWQV